MKTTSGLFGILVLVVLCCTYTASIAACGFSSLQASPFTASYLMSPNYPLDYPTSINCTWDITASHGYVVELNFLDFVTAGSLDGSSSGADTLDIYDGQEMLDNKILGKYYSSYVPADVYSSGRYMTLRFTSDASGVQRGFKIKYNSVIPSPNPTICSPFNNFSTNNAIKITEPSGTIQSPLYASKYPSNIQCTWVISNPNDVALNFKFLNFNIDTKINGECLETRDYVEIKVDHGNPLDPIRLCGSNVEFEAEPRKTIWIRFKSNSDNYYPYSRAGFKAQFNPISSEIDAFLIVIAFVAVMLVGICLCIPVCICLFKRNRRTPGQVIRSHPPQSADVQNPADRTPQNLELAQAGSSLPPSGHFPSSAPTPSSYPIQPYPFSYQHPSAPAAHHITPYDSSQPPSFGLPSRPAPSAPPPSYPG